MVELKICYSYRPGCKGVGDKVCHLIQNTYREQATEVQKIINEEFSNSKIHEEQAPEALKFLLDVLKDVVKEEKEDITYLLSYIKVPISQINHDHHGSIWSRKTSKSPELLNYRVLNLSKLSPGVKSWYKT
ncbi:hypothetical protein C2G38_2037204 [Gigaspora rosea]|uniref:Uncharacterized protein n=1 Tax=Gigaspora rosea TaxID=44941 RepID=A0A397VDI2_9GLOM|nr:hypothetical protein C2G38_2037204 [Gigaspora rosea]